MISTEIMWQSSNLNFVSLCFLCSVRINARLGGTNFRAHSHAFTALEQQPFMIIGIIKVLSVLNPHIG